MYQVWFAGLAMQRGELMTECFELGLNCAAAVAILALAGKTSSQGHHVAAAAGILATPWQRQPPMAVARNRSTTCYAVSAKIIKSA
jgi:hypothetical protein